LSIQVLAHELGHNFGMSHDFDDKHGGQGGHCNGQGIMSYGSFNYNQWSSCSKSDFQQYYASKNWGNGCLENTGEFTLENISMPHEVHIIRKVFLNFMIVDLICY
jgi:M6 family metalloprotease-like protein